MQVTLAVLLLALHHVGAVDVFPPGPLAMESAQKLLGQDDDIDITTGSAFSGLTTFAHLPYSNCFVDDGVAEYDIAILGAPFDTVRSFPVFLDTRTWLGLGAWSL